MIQSRLSTRLAAPALLALVCALAVPMTTGCGRLHRSPKVFVPVQKSAEEQFAYAVRERDRNFLVLRNREASAKRLEARHTVRRSFEMVIENFPEDRKVTPLARLEVADMTAGIDAGADTVSPRQLRDAISQFEGIRNDYPENDFVQAKTIYDEALCRKLLKEYDKAQALFKEVSEEFAASKDKDIRDLVRLSNYQYQQTYVKK